MQVIYRKKYYVVYRFKDEYIVHNTKMEFDKYHTHIKNYNTAKFVITLVLNKSIPHDLNEYLLESLSRISDDTDYSNKVKELLKAKKQKTKKKYININKGIKSK